MVYNLRFFPLQNAVCCIILTYLVPVLFIFYIRGVLKLKKIIPSPKGYSASWNELTASMHLGYLRCGWENVGYSVWRWLSWVSPRKFRTGRVMQPFEASQIVRQVSWRSNCRPWFDPSEIRSTNKWYKHFYSYD
jgi:hypothetical protein